MQNPSWNKNQLNKKIADKINEFVKMDKIP